jgi:hypothetical protein
MLLAGQSESRGLIPGRSVSLLALVSTLHPVLNSIDAWFESRSGHRLFWLRFSCFSSAPPRKCQYSISINHPPLLCISFPISIRQSYASRHYREQLPTASSNNHLKLEAARRHLAQIRQCRDHWWFRLQKDKVVSFLFNELLLYWASWCEVLTALTENTSFLVGFLSAWIIPRLCHDRFLWKHSKSIYQSCCGV